MHHSAFSPAPACPYAQFPQHTYLQVFLGLPLSLTLQPQKLCILSPNLHCPSVRCVHTISACFAGPPLLCSLFPISALKPHKTVCLYICHLIILISRRNAISYFSFHSPHFTSVQHTATRPFRINLPTKLQGDIFRVRMVTRDHNLNQPLCIVAVTAAATSLASTPNMSLTNNIHTSLYFIIKLEVMING